MKFKEIKIATVGLIGLFIATTSLAIPIELVSNGGFETGTLSSWTTSGLGTTGICPSVNRDWNVSSTSNTGCVTVSNPVGSTYAAYAMNDGNGRLTYTLAQTIANPLSVLGGILSFDWTSTNGSDANRTLSVLLAGTPVFNSSTSGIFGWTNVSVDVSSVLTANAGSPITLEFQNFIPATWTGPAGIGLDDVSIIAGTSDVPAPATLLLFGLGLTGLGWSRRKIV